jgi:hypothetical protein
MENMNSNESIPQLPKPAKLTMKLLNTRIDQIQEDYDLLNQRVNELEQHLRNYGHVKSLTAASSETSMDIKQPPNVTDTWSIPRAVRHPAPVKKSFWNKLFG